MRLREDRSDDWEKVDAAGNSVVFAGRLLHVENEGTTKVVVALGTTKVVVALPKMVDAMPLERDRGRCRVYM